MSELHTDYNNGVGVLFNLAVQYSRKTGHTHRTVSSPMRVPDKLPAVGRGIFRQRMLEEVDTLLVNPLLLLKSLLDCKRLWDPIELLGRQK